MVTQSRSLPSYEISSRVLSSPLILLSAYFFLKHRQGERGMLCTPCFAAMLLSEHKRMSVMGDVHNAQS